ncbi:MAG: excinuclease ABC subunit UvrA [Lacipirellulaceae bacterium]
MPRDAATDNDAWIRVRGAATHNLRDVDLDLPRNKLVVFCGASGSGKTSMAIDTLYAEGQRRYIESFSPYTRQFLEQLDKPDVERIDGLPPAIAVTRGVAARSNRSTVATATEVADHLRVLFAALGGVVCPDCDRAVRQDSAETITDDVAQFADGERAMLGFARTLAAGPEAGRALAELVDQGYVRAIAAGRTVELAAASDLHLADGAELFVVTERITGGRVDRERLAESVEGALDGGDGACVLLRQSGGDGGTIEIDGQPWRVARYDTRMRCNGCGREFPKPEPQLLNFNSPLGACPRCEGFGSVVETDMGLVVPDRGKSLKEGAVAPWNTPAYEHELAELLKLAPKVGLRTDVPFAELTPDEVRVVVEGSAEHDFGGLDGFFRWLERRKYKMHLRVFLSRWRSYRPCDACHGSRLKPEALALRLGDASYADVMRLEVREARAWLRALPPVAGAERLTETLASAVDARLAYLAEVGVGYLTLDRTLRTLSTGEAQRVAMTATLGSSLVDMLYVLDEPSTGLHPRDVESLTGAITRLRDRGNTVVVVEHEESALRAADHVVEFGPQAGVEGGTVVFTGTPAEMVECRASRTGDWLAGRRSIRATAATRRAPKHGSITLLGAQGANLAGLDVEFPLGLLCVVTGVSGAGKSSLVRRTLVPALAERLKGAATNAEPRGDDERPLPYADLLGGKLIDEVVLVDQQPIGRSPRSNPVTYIKAFDPIRSVFAEQPDAKARGFTASHFSFNVDGGRCDACQGAGYVEIDMQFLADIFMKCRECDGRRYRNEVLDVKYRQRDVSEVLEMTAHEAFRFFRGEPKVQHKLRTLIDVGLDYLQLGQPASTLSGGEAQRLKLAGRLAAKQAARTLFVLDEPTTGLHFSDVERLVDCFGALLDVGHSLVVIEHNVPMMMAADWIIDLGPGAAAEGGRVVVQGPPEKVAACAESATGRALAEAFRRRDEAQAALDAEEAAMEED